MSEFSPILRFVKGVRTVRRGERFADDVAPHHRRHPAGPGTSDDSPDDKKPPTLWTETRPSRGPDRFLDNILRGQSKPGPEGHER